MKARLFLPLLFFSVLIVACSKPQTDTAQNNSKQKDTTTVIPISTVPSNAPPLPNTVDKIDTLKVMAYNVLNYGDGCQGSNTTLNGYLKTIINYTQPDLFSCEKMLAFNIGAGTAFNLADTITQKALNAVFPGRYAYAIPTNLSHADKMSVLFYNKQKLTLISTQALVANITDFDLYKLYYNDPNIAITHDTTFLYVVVNHTQSGSSSASRDIQLTAEMKALRSKFMYLPNLINMGDFNTHNSLEPGYQSIISATDTATKMSDPPFYPDNAIHYPADWDSYPNLFSRYLTTSTRLSGTIPNSCGTSGGAKSWYDHIFISPWLVTGKNYMKYVLNSYQTIGNDGNRLGVDENSSTPVINTSIPADVAQALFQFSNKYPITIKLLVKANRNAYSITDPSERN